MNFNLSQECVTVVVDTIKADTGVAKRWLKAADMLRAEGVTSEVLSGDKEFRAAFKANVIMLTFTKVEQSIKAKPANSRSDEDKVTARWVDTETASRLGKVVRHLKKAEQEEAMTEDERGARRTAELSTRLQKDLSRWIERIEKAERLTFSGTMMIAALKACLALIK